MKYTIYTLVNHWGSWDYITPLDKIAELEAWWGDPDNENPLPEGVIVYDTPNDLLQGFLVFENPIVQEELPATNNHS